MIFANVTDIAIPQGNIIKIQETNSGRVLWMKKKIIKNPVMFLEIYSSGKTTTHYKCYSKYNAYNISSSIASEGWNLGSLNIGVMRYCGKVSTGSTFTAYYVDSNNPQADYPAKRQLITDAVWGVTPTGICPATSSGSYDTTAMLKITTCPVILSSKTGSSTKISSVKNFKTFVSAFESSSFSASYSKTQYPNIYVEFGLTISSPSLGVSTRSTDPSKLDECIQIGFFTPR